MNTRHHYLSLLRTFALATLTAAAVAACTDDNGDPAGREPLTPPADGISVTFTADINPGSDTDPAGTPDTRTVLTPTTEGGFTVTWKGSDYDVNDRDMIYIWAARGSEFANEGNAKEYYPFTSAVSSVLGPKNSADPLTIPSTGEWAFTALYGTTGSSARLGSVAISPLTQSAPGKTEHIAAADFSVATAKQNILDENSEMPSIISFKFKHMLSALQLQVQNKTGAELTVEEIRLSVSGDQIAYQRAYDVATGKWEAGGGTKSDYLQLNITNRAALASNAADPQKFHMLLFPGYENETLTITVITDRGEFALTKPAPAGGFLAGKNYLTNITITSNPGTGSGETWTEYITSKAELIAFREKVNGGDTYDGKTLRLTADIDLGNNSWTLIGIDVFKSFWGTFDGGGHHISGLNVNIGTEYAGLFGYVYSGTVRNLRVSGNVTTTGGNAGGIVGRLERSSVENCIFSGKVKGDIYVGGIAGCSGNNSRITGCHTKDKVTATTNRVGGIVGWNKTDCVIESCYSEAEVKSNNSLAGGIAGNNNGTISHCYATGAISGTYIVGGIAGDNSGGTVKGCIALNPSLTRTSGDKTTFGRILGNANGTIDNCAAFNNMKFTDATSSQPIANRTGADGTGISASTCLTKAAYTTDRGFTEATATTPGWAFGSSSPWTYLQWNKAFDNWNISADQYRIRVPQHLSVTN